MSGKASRVDRLWPTRTRAESRFSDRFEGDRRAIHVRRTPSVVYVATVAAKTDDPRITPLPDTHPELAFEPDFLADADAGRLVAALFDEVPWSQTEIRMFGRAMPSPRLTSWHGDPGAIYRYSGLTLVPRPWTDGLLELRSRLERHIGHRFNSVLANLYRDGRDSMGWHSDDEPELGPEPEIASISLGATRRFLVRHKAARSVRTEIELTHGSLLRMTGSTQARWQHAVPKTKRRVGHRINLTFRQILVRG